MTYAHIFYGILLPASQQRSWFNASQFPSEDYDCGRFRDPLDEFIHTKLEQPVYDIWNSRKMDDVLSQSCGCVLKKFVHAKDTYFGVLLPHTHRRTKEVDRLGRFNPDPPDYLTKVETAVVAVENEIELYTTYKCGIPTKHQIQWHLVLEQR